MRLCLLTVLTTLLLLPQSAKARGDEKLCASNTPQGDSANVEELSQCGAKGAIDRETGGVEEAPQSSEATVIVDSDKSKAKITIRELRKTGILATTLSAPLDKKDGVTDFITRGGLTEDVALTMSWTRNRFNDSKLREALKGVDLVGFGLNREAICDVWDVKVCSDTEVEQAIFKKLGETTESQKIAQDVLSEFEKVEIKVASQDREAVIKPLLETVPLRFAKLTGSLGRTERDYFNSSGEELEDDRLSYLFEGSWGRIYSDSRLSISATYKRAFKNQDKVQACVDVEDAERLEKCKELPFGEASKVDSAVLAFEYRRWWKFWATSPKVGYDFESDVWGISVPVYVIPDTKGRLSGGVRFDWEEDKDLVVSLFVSSPLGVQ